MLAPSPRKPIVVLSYSF